MTRAGRRRVRRPYPLRRRRAQPPCARLGARCPVASGQPANLVLGQSDFSHRAPNDDDQDGVTDGATERTLHHPTGLAVAGQFLVVTDTYNHRYLLFRGR